MHVVIAVAFTYFFLLPKSKPMLQWAINSNFILLQFSSASTVRVERIYYEIVWFFIHKKIRVARGKHFSGIAPLDTNAGWCCCCMVHNWRLSHKLNIFICLHCNCACKFNYPSPKVLYYQNCIHEHTLTLALSPILIFSLSTLECVHKYFLMY